MRRRLFRLDFFPPKGGERNTVQKFELTHADDQSTGAETPQIEAEDEQGAGPGPLPAETRGVPASQDNDPEEAQFRIA
jgi:hypothetical protein